LIGSGHLIVDLDPEELASRSGYVPLRPGVDLLVLREDPLTGSQVGIVRYQPGARVPTHEHTGYEHLMILSGEQKDENGSYGVGTLVINPPGSLHSVQSAQGCLVLAIWEKPVRFLENE
jgi:anti-sigma factor ChrR (cupin superfamily)